MSENYKVVRSASPSKTYYSRKQIKSQKMSNKDLISRKTFTKVPKNNGSKMLDNGTQTSTRSMVSVVLGIFLIILLVVAMLGSLRGTGQTITFTGFLEYLSQSPSLNFFDISSFKIVGDWGLFDFLRNFFNLFTTMIGVSIWIFQLFWNLIAWLLYFFRFLFFS